jgi:hypothetical protein
MFRSACKSDIEQIFRLGLVQFNELERSTGWELERIESIISEGISQVYEKSGLIVGFSLVTSICEFGDGFHVEWTAVSSNIKNGMGARLFINVIEKLKRIKHSNVYIDVLITNRPAINMVQRYGFVESKRKDEFIIFKKTF